MKQRKSFRSHVRLGACVMVLVVFVACGGDDDDASEESSTTATTPDETTSEPTETSTSQPARSAADIDPCQLVSKAQAEALMATPLEDGVLVDTGPSCTYSGPVTGPTAQVEVYVGDGAKKFLDVDRDLGHVFTPVEGLGDEAYLEDGSIFFSKADIWVAIRYVSLDDPQRFNEPIVNLAQEVAAQI